MRCRAVERQDHRLLDSGLVHVQDEGPQWLRRHGETEDFVRCPHQLRVLLQQFRNLDGMGVDINHIVESTASASTSPYCCAASIMALTEGKRSVDRLTYSAAAAL